MASENIFIYERLINVFLFSLDNTLKLLSNIKGSGGLVLHSENNRIVVIDTNVILFDAQAIYKFHNSDIHVPISVIEEIDRFKRELGENGRNARQFSRLMDVLRAGGSLRHGVKLEQTGSKVFVDMDIDLDSIPSGDLDLRKADNRILACAMALQNR